MSQIKVLLIDDSPTIRSIVKVYLMGHGFDFLEAGDGERGLQVAKLMGPDLIIADVNMPRMDGISLVKRMRADPGALSRIPVILITGTAHAAEEEARQCGANAFLRKPVSSEALAKAVSECLPGAVP